MHEKPKSKFSTDYYLYKGLGAVAPKMCWIHPNTVTLIGALLIIPIVFNILYDQSTIVLILLLIARYILDGLDGTLARKCDTGSKLGAYLDLGFDYLFFIVIYCALAYKIISDKLLAKYILQNPFKIILISIAVCLFIVYNYYFITEIVELNSEKKIKINKWNQLIQDNSLILFLVVGLLIKYLTKKSF